MVIGWRWENSFSSGVFPLKAPVLPATAILYRTLKKANQIFLANLIIRKAQGFRELHSDNVLVTRLKLRAYYDKKRAEGKLFKVAIIACVNKLIHWIFAILSTKEAFHLE
jgi:hypothetical protein